MATIQNLPPRVALVKRRGAGVAQIKTENIPPYRVTANDVDALEGQLARIHGEPLANLTEASSDTVQSSAPAQLVDWETVPNSPQYLYDYRTREEYSRLDAQKALA